MASSDDSISRLLSTLTSSLNSAASSFPSDHKNLVPPADGVSLFDVKNEILLSYIQNLVFLILFKLRNQSRIVQNDLISLDAEAVKKLVELRVYIEKGLRPLEGRLKYQIDKVLRAADEAEKSSTSHLNGHGKSVNSTDPIDDDSEASNSDSETTKQPSNIDDLKYRPNIASLLRKVDSSADAKPLTTRRDGAYKPPRITPTSMPFPKSTLQDRSAARKQHQKSYLLDEYVSTELSSAPLAEPSIGSNSTILNRGRSSLSAHERQRQKERQEYEERNLARLPAESKADRRKARSRGEGARQRNQYGGEDFLQLGEVGDRVARTVRRSTDNTAGGRRSLVERREKRRLGSGAEARDGGGGTVGIGEAFAKRRKVLEGRMEKKARKGR